LLLDEEIDGLRGLELAALKVRGFEEVLPTAFDGARLGCSRLLKVRGLVARVFWWCAAGFTRLL